MNREGKKWEEDVPRKHLSKLVENIQGNMIWKKTKIKENNLPGEKLNSFRTEWGVRGIKKNLEAWRKYK